MSANPQATEPAEGEKILAKIKKMRILIATVMALAAGGTAVNAAESKTAPVYLPMDNMVMNLADPGGERVAQIGVTLEVADAKALETVKAYLPTIRNGVLMLVSRRTSDELLSRKGKEKLAQDILKVTTLPFGGEEEDEQVAPAKKAKGKRKVQVDYPVVGVLFSSFIVQ